MACAQQTILTLERPPVGGKGFAFVKDEDAAIGNLSKVHAATIIRNLPGIRDTQDKSSLGIAEEQVETTGTGEEEIEEGVITTITMTRLSFLL